MSYVSGDGKPRQKIALFLIGEIIFLALVYVGTNLSDDLKLPALSVFRIISLVGLGIELYALFKLRQYDTGYIVGFVFAVITGIFLIIGLTFYFLDDYKIFTFKYLDSTINICSLVEGTAETLTMLLFVRATNRLAQQSYKGMPKLTLILTIAFIVCLVADVLESLALIFNFTITNVFIGELLAKVVNLAAIVKFVGVIIFLAYALNNIKD